MPKTASTVQPSTGQDSLPATGVRQEKPRSPFYSTEPTLDIHEKMDEFRDRYSRLWEAILAEVPPCRERSLAITALEESALWLNKGVSNGAN